MIDAGYAVLSRALFISPSDSYVQLAGNEMSVRMGWTFPRDLRSLVRRPRVGDAEESRSPTVYTVGRAAGS